MLVESVVIESIAEISPQQWNQLHDSDYPFIQHAFLLALEKHACVSPRWGWLPKHMLFYQQGHLVAAIPLYEKRNNYGEFVFDQAWEQAWGSVGLDYYPKLVSAAPYTPARGPRLLFAPEVRTDSNRLQQLLAQVLELLKNYTQQEGYSGFHLLFSDEQPLLADDELILRHDVQFHWFNQNYQTFDDFLAQLKSKKRKNIRQERKAVHQQGITFRQLNGHQATAEDWQTFDYFYQKTFIEKWSTPTLNLGFFKEIAQTMPDKILLVLADLEGETVAGALMFLSDSVLYGRHWGCKEDIKHLHFETCFYQGIDFAIARGLQRFEPGAGGEHKIARGFVPVFMQSSHWLTVNPFVDGIARFVKEEKTMILQYADDVWQGVPYQDPSSLQTPAADSEKLFV